LFESDGLAGYYINGASMRQPFAICALLLLLVAAFSSQTLQGQDNEPDYARLTGSVFYPEPTDPFHAPQVWEIKPPAIPEAESIWGATGRDSRGHIWIGVSTRRSGTGAHLLELDPKANLWKDHGSVLDHLRRLGLYKEGMGQIKIHSKIVQAEDGWLYFASTDEEGESAAGSVLAKNGGHLWRIYPGTKTWEHLLAAPEAIVAVSGVGRYVYALGYWNHVLFQFDTHTKQHRRLAVGSADGHVSRNFLADLRGHAFVPRVTKRATGGYEAVLVEYDEQLNEIGATVLQYYLDKASPEDNHGIVGLAYLPDHRMVFTTHRGQVYLITPAENGPSQVIAKGWLHPQGEAYAPGLYAFGGNSWIAGIIQRGTSFEWVVFNLEKSGASSQSFRIPTGSLKRVLLYGSIATDDLGKIYAVGWAGNEQDGQRPLVLQILPAR
jgi:hypothetical protein